ncbi:MAG TPA: aminoglycoside phosphotransferase family protein [Flavitalea sp.]|nr:aminoglycoside phosphotransferase family protein [Flavitalea sp.]
MLNEIAARYGLHPEIGAIHLFGTGLINNTWLVRDKGRTFILQKINTAVFKDPYAIAANLKALDDYLKQKAPDYLFVKPLTTIDQQEMVQQSGGHFRLFAFVEGSRTYDTIQSPLLAFEAARQFGLFTRLLSEFDSSLLKDSIPDFHNLPLRYEQFNQSLSNGDPGRIAKSAGPIEKLQTYKNIAEEFQVLSNNGGLKKRVTHHDTKISNVLFNNADQGLCVIDLDTVMSGYFISDVGDMMRTYLSPVSEEEKDLTKIEVRDDYFEAILRGYLGEMKDELTDLEKQLFVYAGKYMIYMQALRFLTDHLNNDRYYGAKYPGHNLLRANNQIELLNKLIEKEKPLLEKVDQFLNTGSLA